MSRRGDSPCTTRNDQQTPFLRIAELILPWLTAQELASLSSTCTTLKRLCKSITNVRSADAARSLEPLPVPFINTVDAQPYAYFLYSPTQLLPSSSLRRQFWGSPPNAIPNLQFGWNQFGLVSDAGGCDCSEKCVGDGDDRTLDCPCSVLRCGEVITECGPNCGCASDCGNRATQKGVAVRVEIVRVVNKGWGLFAAQFIQSGQFVCEYTGELLKSNEARTRQGVYDELSRSSRFASALLVVREHLPSRKACFRINIDATRVGNVGRFINHSCDGGNLSTVLVRNSGALLPHVCLSASRDIHAGEELSFSYGDIRERADGLQCFCGSPCCFGILPSEET